MSLRPVPLWGDGGFGMGKVNIETSISAIGDRILVISGGQR
ncbi:MAG: hypothetical protein WBB28_24900 [Crinalium sp.]